MSALYRGLPEGALSKQETTGLPPWGMQEELMAQLVEEVSVLAADHRRKEPRVLPRPGDDTPSNAPREGLTGTAETGYQANGAAALLTAAQVYGAVRASHE